MKKGWAPFIITSFILSLGYYFLGHERGEALSPFLKGLTTLQHFGIHYIVGIFFGLLIIIGYNLAKHQRPNEPLILWLTVLWSHWPDIRFLFREKPHDPWEIIFFFHTLVDEVPILFWIFLAANAALLSIYLYPNSTPRAESQPVPLQERNRS